MTNQDPPVSRFKACREIQLRFLAFLIALGPSWWLRQLVVASVIAIGMAAFKVSPLTALFGGLALGSIAVTLFNRP